MSPSTALGPECIPVPLLGAHPQHLWLAVLQNYMLPRWGRKRFFALLTGEAFCSSIYVEGSMVGMNHHRDTWKCLQLNENLVYQILADHNSSQEGFSAVVSVI